MIEIPSTLKYWDFTSKSLYVLPGESCSENPEQCLIPDSCSAEEICCPEGQKCAPYQYFWYEDVPAVTPMATETIGIAVAGAGAFVVGAGLFVQRRRSIRTVPTPANSIQSATKGRVLTKHKSMVAANPTFKGANV
jgi:hypothetical protein